LSRKALGKGLAAIIPEGNKQVAVTEARQIPIADIRANPYQPRLNPERALTDLAASIRENGIIQPVVVRRRHDSFELIVGERRLRAAMLAGLTHVPAVISNVAEPKMLEIALIENVQRTDLDPVETALAYKRLAEEFNLTHEDIAAKVGKSRSAVTNSLRLLSLPQKVREALSAGLISEGHARAVLGITNRQSQEDLCARIIEEGLSVRTVERLCEAKPKRAAARKRNSDPNLTALEEALQQRLGTRVRIHQTDDRGEIAVEFRDASDRERIVRLILRSGD
jgi:ParB family transcriptional regulator, chromosome partitioning protein